MTASLPAEDWILGLDIGATKIGSAAGRADGTILEELIEPCPRGGDPQEMQTLMCRLADDIIGRRGQPTAIGVSIGGPLDAEAGVVYSPPNLPRWDQVPLKAMLTERYSLPTYLEHDAKAGAIAEWLFGAGQGCDNLVFLTFGTGLGAGVIVDRRLCRGRNDNFGAVGHWRMSDTGPTAYGKTGALEAFASGTGIVALAHERYPDHWPTALTAAQVIEMARDGEPAAQAVVAESSRMLGRGIAYLIDLLAPDLVVLGSLAVRAGELFLPTVRDIVAAECIPGALPCPIVPSQLGERIGTTAAVCAAIYHGRLGNGQHS